MQFVLQIFGKTESKSTDHEAVSMNSRLNFKLQSSRRFVRRPVCEIDDLSLASK